MCLCIYGSRIFEISPPNAAHLSDTFDGISPPVIMSNLNKFGSFTLGWGGGVSTPSCYSQHTYIYFHFFQNCATHFGRCPMLLSPPSNTKHSVDQPCTYDILSNTKHSVDLYHALTPMSCDVLVHNAMQSCHCPSIICYTYNECYMCIQPMHNTCIIKGFISTTYKFQVLFYSCKYTMQAYITSI